MHDQSDAVHGERHLDVMLLVPVDDWLLGSQIPEEETMLLSEPQVAEAAHPPRHEEWAPKPNNAAKQMGAVTEPQGT